MTSLTRALALFLASAGATQAGGPTVVASDPAPAAAPAPVAVHDWSGPYVGLSYGNTSADILFTPGVAFDFESGSVVGIHAGYLFQRGSWVYGGELAYGSANDTFIPGFNGDDEIEQVLDLKARVGYAANRTLFYGVLGYSKANYVEPPLLEFDLDGLAYGIGAEFAASQRVTVGLEYLTRNLSGDADVAAVSADVNLDTLSLRVGLSF